ncbi:MAG TPA: glutathione S-transferase family protein [Solirubrobacterales bacterium]|nr:glutathione S-transferase family protein [Solirubrobacterales bacterium]
MTNTEPILWQLPLSHYSEKARWALAHKSVEHQRRSPMPGMHMAIALWLTRGKEKVFPVLQMEGRTIGDSTAVIAALEQRHPDPPLYPADPDQRHRALGLEDFFDEELGPYTRLLPFHELINEPEMFAEVAADSVPGPLGNAKGFIGLYARTYTSIRFGANSDAKAAVAREKITLAMDRLDAELAANGGDYLVGERFSVADLTAASLFYPLVGPEGGPLPPDTPAPPALERFRDTLRDRPGYTWVEEMFRRHRHPAGTAAAGASR